MPIHSSPPCCIDFDAHALNGNRSIQLGEYADESREDADVEELLQRLEDRKLF
jgi:hypothetical protein